MIATQNNSKAIRKVQRAIDRINAFTPWFAKQHHFYQDDTRFVWQIAASQSGKTETAVPKFLRRILKRQKALREKHGRYMDCPYWIIVPTRELAIPVKDKMKTYLPANSGLIDKMAQGHSSAFWRQTDGSGTAFLKYGAQIAFKSFDQGERLVAASLGGFWADECARMDDINVWQNIFARLKETKGFGMGTSSPAARGGFYTGIYKRYQDHPEHSWRKWTSYDSAESPHSSITVKEIELARASMPPHSFAREYLAEWASAEGQIYPGFDWDKNVVKDLPFAHDPKFIIGMDVGYAHPTAIEVVRFDGEEFIFTEEHTLIVQAPSDIVKRMVELFMKYRPDMFVYDYGGGGTALAIEWDKFWTAVRFGKIPAEYLDDYTLQNYQKVAVQAMRCLSKAYKNVTDGIQMMSAGFSNGKIKVAEGCKKLIEEIDEYVWKDPGKTSDDVPVKENDDHVDAARYTIVTYAAQRLSDSRSKSLFGVTNYA